MKHSKRWISAVFLLINAVCLFSFSVYASSVPPSSSGPPAPESDPAVASSVTASSLEEASSQAEEVLPAAAEPVFTVELPQAIPFYIDPFEISGRGQLYSQEFTVKNHGTKPVTLVFTQIQMEIYGDGIFSADTPEECSQIPNEKQIYMQLDISGDREPVPVTTAGISQEIALLLSPAGQPGDGFTFSFSGRVNAQLDEPIKWEDGEVAILMQYRMEWAEPEPLPIVPVEALEEQAQSDIAAEPSSESLPSGEEGGGQSQSGSL